MGFFKDFKRDFAQAVNELMPEKDELASEYDDEDMVNTFDENDNMEIAPEDMLEDIDDYGDDIPDNNQSSGGFYDTPGQAYGESDVEYNISEDEDDQSGTESGVDDLRDVPSAELISEHDFNDLNSLNDMENMEAMEAMENGRNEEDGAAGDYVSYSENASHESVQEEDEIRSLENLDEQDMLEGMEDASRLEEKADEESGYYGNPFEQIGEEKNELHEMNLMKDIEDAIMKEDAEGMAEQYEDNNQGTTENNEEIYASGAFTEADKFREDVMAEVEMNSRVTETSKSIDDIFEVDTTYITKSTTIKGNLTTEGSVDVLGTVKGNINCTGKLIVGGTIKGDIEAGEMYANAAKIEGNVESEGSVKIGVGSVVVGDIMATSAVIAGAINGDIDVHGPVIVDSTAVIMGNIKSRSVQINNGAVIEGFCSQCYSEIDVKSFFDMETDEDEEEAQKKTEDEVEADEKNDIESENEPEIKEKGNADKTETPSDNRQSVKNNNGRKSNRKNGKGRGNQRQYENKKPDNTDVNEANGSNDAKEEKVAASEYNGELESAQVEDTTVASTDVNDGPAESVSETDENKEAKDE